jgi:hypothetical protein
MRSLRHQRIKLRDATRGQSAGSEREKQIRIVVPCLVRNDCQHPRVGSYGVERRLNYTAQLFGWQRNVGSASPD